MSDQQPYRAHNLGVMNQNSYFCHFGGTGFKMRMWGDLFINFWNKGEQSSKDRNNTLKLKPTQVMLLNNTLNWIKMQRLIVWKNRGDSEPAYFTIPEGYCRLELSGMDNGELKSFGYVEISTVEVDGINRIRLVVKRGEKVNSVTFCDSFLVKNCSEDLVTKTDYDVLDSSFYLFCNDIVQSLNFSSWTYGAFNALSKQVTGNKDSNGGGNNNYKRQNNNSYRNQRTQTEEPVFEDDGEDF